MKRDLERLANRKFDVLVVGGGIHGAIAAWDAALRGLSVALIERGDFGSGTSQNSLKIIHGGLRYLQDGNLSRIRTMARERTTWMKIAPHLVHPLTCLMPTRRKLSRSRLAMGIALTANDLLSFDRNRLADPEKNLESGKIVSKHELSNILPGYDISTSTGAAVWHDGQVYNTERLLLEFILSASDSGAEIANYVEAIGFIKQNDRVMGVRARDILSGQVFDIRSSMVINCAGAWIDGLLETVPLRSEYSTSIAMNIFVNQVWSGVAAGLPTQPVNGKPPQILFFVPWRDKTMIGTWHVPWNHDPDSFMMNESFVENFIHEINSAHPPLKLSLESVQHVNWGFLPVNKADAHRDQVRLTRDGVVIDHQKKDGVSGLISVLGVKFTTARVVAEKAVDLAVNQLALNVKKCQTQKIRVKGGKIGNFNVHLQRAVSEASAPSDRKIIQHWAYTYGSDHEQFKADGMRHPELIDPSLPVTDVEVVHAVHEEMAMKLTDVIQRRTELGATGLPSMNTLQKCADLMGRELGWTFERQQHEIDSVIQAYPFKQKERITA